MRTKARASLLALLVWASVVVSSAAFSSTGRILVLTETAGARHASVSAAASAVQEIAVADGFVVDVADNSSMFTDAGLQPYSAIVFLLTTGDVLTADEQMAFERFIQRGGGFAGVHSAAETESAWDFYKGLVGTTFVSNAPVQTAVVTVADRAHESTASLPERWSVNDEWYNFASNPRGKVHVLATVDERTYGGGGMGYDHPITWCQGYRGGRSWYTGMGHSSALYSDPNFRAHLLGGIRFAAAGDARAGCGGTVWSNFDKVVADPSVVQPMSLEVAPDGRVFYLERTGAVRIYEPGQARSITAGKLRVNSGNESGLQGIELDPEFATNGWIYLYYTSAEPYENRLSRFTMVGNTMDLASEIVMIRFPGPTHCCHEGGSLAFGPDGLLYLSIGDGTIPWLSGGYAPIDERRGQAFNDAQSTSANSRSIRGKILRIDPQPDGTYTIPPGNLFSASEGLPETYVMGLRNPFRITVDQRRNWLYWGDVGPDAAADDPDRGPRAHDEINRAKQAGNYGWPYCVGNNLPYRDYDFATGLSGPSFVCDAPVNESPNNTGVRSLPPAQPPLITYTHAFSAQYPELGSGGMTAEVGPVYRWGAANAASGLPRYYDDTLFIFDWSRGWIKEVKLDGDGNVLKINPFVGGVAKHPIEVEQGPDGSLWVLDWGETTSFDSIGSLKRVEYSTSHTPQAKIQALTPTWGAAPLTVELSSAGSFDPDPADVLSFAWDFGDDGIIDSSQPSVSHSFPKGTHTVRLIVTDSAGKFSSATVKISSGNDMAKVAIEEPTDGTLHRFGESFDYRISATDSEDGSTSDGTIPCSTVQLRVSLGHDGHTHEVATHQGCEGKLQTAAASHGEEANIYTVLTATYTDRGGDGVEPLTASTSIRLEPFRRQAETYTSSKNVDVLTLQYGPDRLQQAMKVRRGGFSCYGPMNLSQVDAVRFRAGTWWFGGRIEVRVDSPTGQKIGEVDVTPTSPTSEFEMKDFVATIQAPAGTHELCLSFRQRAPTTLSNGYLDGEPYLFIVNWLEWITLRQAAPGVL